MKQIVLCLVISPTRRPFGPVLREPDPGQGLGRGVDGGLASDRGLDAETGLRESAEGVPLNRVCSAAEVADMVLYACSDSAAFITGYPLVLDGGNRA